jgi:hypothetical protein
VQAIWRAWIEAITSILTPSSFLAAALGPVLVPAPRPATEPSSPVATFEESLFRGGMFEGLLLGCDISWILTIRVLTKVGPLGVALAF